MFETDGPARGILPFGLLIKHFSEKALKMTLATDLFVDRVVTLWWKPSVL